MTRTRHPGPVAWGPRTGHQNIGAPRGSGARGYNPYQYSGVIFAQRSDATSNTLGLGISGRRLITQATPSTRSPEICTECRYWTAQVVSHARSQDAADPLPSRAELQQLGTRGTELQVLLEYSDGSGQRQEIQLDAGPGFGMTFWGSAPKVWLLLDSAMAVYDTPGGPSILPAGTLTNNIIEATLQCGQNYAMRALWQVTNSQEIPADTNANFPVPPRAQYVRVTQGSAGPPIATLDFRARSGLSVGTYSFDPGLRNGPRMRIPGNTFSMFTVASVNDARNVSAIFEVEL